MEAKQLADELRALDLDKIRTRLSELDAEIKALKYLHRTAIRAQRAQEKEGATDES